MTETQGSMVCVWSGCEHQGSRTDEPRCPHCGIPTEPIGSTVSTLARLTEDQLAQRYGDSSRHPFIVTTNDLPGYRITAVHGAVFGLIVMSRDFLSNLGASVRALGGGEVTAYTELLAESRNVAQDRLWDETSRRGGNAVIAFRFDCSHLGEAMTEVAAYGTAVSVERLPTEPDPQSN